MKAARKEMIAALPNYKVVTERFAHAGARLTGAMQLLCHPDAAKQFSGGEALREELLRLIPIARLVSSAIGQLPLLRTNCMSMVVLFSKLDPNTQSERAYRAIFQRIERIHSQLESLFKKLGLPPLPEPKPEQRRSPKLASRH